MAIFIYNFIYKMNYTNSNLLIWHMKTVNVKSLGDCPYLISLEADDFIGRGSYAEVRRAFNKKNTNERLVAKIFDLHEHNKSQSAFKQLSIINDLPLHSNLVQYKRVKITSKNKLYIIMEQCPFTLKTKLRNIKFSNLNTKFDFSQQEVWQFLRQFCLGYQVLFNKGIIHRDIKPDNILIGYDGLYKIADFGLAQIYDQINPDNKIRGSLCYMAPQLLENSRSLSSMNDVYSLGVTLYELCFAKLPYIRRTESLQSVVMLIKQVRNSSLRFPDKHEYSNDLVNLLNSMLEKQPTKRCTWEYIFFVLVSKSDYFIALTVPHLQNGLQQNQKRREFRVIQISDALLKNLSQLDTNVYKSLNNDSLMIIDHIEAEIISKRQVIFYCDRLQYRLQIILQKNKRAGLHEFRIVLLRYTCCLAQKLDECFEKYYSKMEKSQFLKIVGSKKYTFIRNLIKEDRKALQAQLEDSMLQLNTNKNCLIITATNKTTQTKQIHYLETEVYESCFKTVLDLYSLNCFPQCRQVDELQKWLQLKQKSEGVLARLRKNENALKQFDEQAYNMGRAELKSKVSSCYVYHLNSIDKGRQHQK